MTDRLDEIARQLLHCRELPGQVYIYPHTGIDGDALGSSLALLLILGKAGIKARFVYDEPIPDKYGFLPAVERVEPFDESGLDSFAADQILGLCVDCSSPARTGRRQALLERAPLMAVIDHHVSEGESGPLRLIDPQAAASGELVFRLCRHLEQLTGLQLLDSDIATLLMTALIADTGRFTFSNTTSQTFSIAAQLMVCSVNIREIVYQLFDLTRAARLRLTGRVFSETTFHSDGKIALACVNQAMMEQYGAQDSDLDGLAGQLRNIEGVQVSLLIRELPEGRYRVNIRSGSAFDASRFAKSLGGGGHARAAGVQLKGTGMQDVVNTLLMKAGEWL